MGATTIMFNGAQLMLPLYDPNNKERTEAAQELVNALRSLMASFSVHQVTTGPSRD